MSAFRREQHIFVSQYLGGVIGFVGTIIQGEIVKSFGIIFGGGFAIPSERGIHIHRHAVAGAIRGAHVVLCFRRAEHGCLEPPVMVAGQIGFHHAPAAIIKIGQLKTREPVA